MMDFSTLFADRQLPSRDSNRLKWFLIGFIVVVVCIHLLSLTIYPQVFIDEGWFANTSWSWLKTGIVFDTIHTGPLDQFGDPWVTDNFLAQLPYMLMYRITGVGLFQTRLVSWAFGVVLLVATAQVGKRLYSLNTGLVAALLLSLSLPFLDSSRIRQDIVLATMIMSSFWLSMYGFETERLWAHFLAGLILGLGFDVQQSSIVFIPPLAALYLFHYRARILFKRGTWAVGVGGALGLGYYVVSHVLPNSEVYSKLMSFYFVSDADSRVPLTNPDILLESAIREVARYRFRSNLFDLGMIIVGGLFLLLRRRKSDFVLLTFTGSAFVSFILLSSNKTTLYAINLYPFFMLVVAAGFVAALHRWQGKNLARVIGAALVVFTVYCASQVSSLIYSNRDYDYYAITDQMRDVIPADKRVLGMPTWWLGFVEYDYRSSLSVPYYRFFNDYDVNQAMEALRPDYIIVDDAQGAVLADEGQTLPQGMNVYRVPREEFVTFLETRTELVLDVLNLRNNHVQVYKVNWDE